jgi:hypothetical protein
LTAASTRKATEPSRWAATIRLPCQFLGLMWRHGRVTLRSRHLKSCGLSTSRRGVAVNRQAEESDHPEEADHQPD